MLARTRGERVRRPPKSARRIGERAKSARVSAAGSAGGRSGRGESSGANRCAAVFANTHGRASCAATPRRLDSRMCTTSARACSQPAIDRAASCSHLVMHRLAARMSQQLARHSQSITTQRYMHLSPGRARWRSLCSKPHRRGGIQLATPRGFASVETYRRRFSGRLPTLRVFNDIRSGRRRPVSLAAPDA
jgi:hypothetical protein